MEDRFKVRSAVVRKQKSLTAGTTRRQKISVSGLKMSKTTWSQSTNPADDTTGRFSLFCAEL